MSQPRSVAITDKLYELMMPNSGSTSPFDKMND
jgi:hypothetical protein